MIRPLIILLFFTFQYSFACDCIAQDESLSVAVPLAVENASAVFIGEVIATTTSMFMSEDLTFSDYQIVTYKVLESFKGVDSDYFIIIGGNHYLW